MSLKLFVALAICCAFAASYVADARHVPGHRERQHVRSGINAYRGGVSHKQARVFPGAVAIKKLVLLKFKKIVPISLILLKSSNDNEAELVPVYPTDQIPDNVQFIPTPNGISGHKDVQAIAIPSELHDQLQINGLANLENIEALLQNAAISESTNTAAGAGAAAAALGDSNSANIAVAQPEEEDTPLDIKESDEDQLLEDVADVEVPEQPMKESTAAPVQASGNSLRRLASDELIRSSLRTQPQQQTTVEEIPLLLYSANDTPAASYAGVAGRLSGRRYIGATPVRRRQY